MITDKNPQYIKKTEQINKYRNNSTAISGSKSGDTKIEKKTTVKSSSTNFKTGYNHENDLFFQLSSLPYFILAADGTFVSVNQAGEKLLQRSINELRLLNFKNFIDQKSKYIIDNIISKTLVEKNKEVCEIFLYVDDKQIPVRIIATGLPHSFESVFEVNDLTPQKRIQTIIDNSYKTLIEEAGIGIFVADVHGNYTAVNKYVCEMLGYSLEELLKMNIKDVLIADELKEMPLLLKKILLNYQVFSERNMIHKDGSLVPVEISGKVLSDGRLQGIVRNISDRKKAEKALIESEANYKHAESIAHLGSWQMEIKTGKSKWSDEFFRICGYEPQSFEPNKTLRYQVVHPEDREISEKAIQKAISEKSSYKIEKRILRPNGDIRYVLSVGEIITDENNQPLELKGVFLDITDLKNTELSLKKSEEKYRKLLEFLPIGMLIKNKDNEIVYWNKKSNEILDIDLLRKDPYNLKVTRKDETTMSLDEYPGTKALKEERTIENLELGIELADRKIWLNATAAPMPGNEEVILAFMDITEKIEKERQLSELSQRLQELNATKDKFFSIIAHDLKNPFNSILGFSELLLKNLEKYSPAEIEKFVGIIYETSQKTYTLLENLLLWSRSQTGTMEFNPEPLLLNNLVENNIEFIKPMAFKKQIKINYEYTGELNAMIDKNMMDTVFRNILTNAVKFSYPNSEIYVKAFEDDNNYVVSVKDSGIGIDPENMEKLFRFDSKFSVLGTNKEKGSGLGLLICKEFVERNKGKIHVSSTFGKGTELQVVLPKV